MAVSDDDFFGKHVLGGAGQPAGSLPFSAHNIAALIAEGDASFTPQPSRLRCSPTLPHPVVARDDILFDMIRDTLIHAGHGQALTNPDCGEQDIAEAIRALYLHHPQAVMAQWSELYLSCHAAVNIAFASRQGRILRATDALETLLSHTDIDDTLPTSMFRPPHPAIYLHFGPLWRQQIRALSGPALAISGASEDEIALHGCHLLQSRYYCEECGRNQRAIGHYVVIEFHNAPGFYSMFGASHVLHDEDAPVGDPHPQDGSRRTRRPVRKVACGTHQLVRQVVPVHGSGVSPAPAA